MRRSTSLLAALALTLSPAIIFGQSVVTTPVGFTSVVVNANSIKALSLPFNTPPDFAAAISTVNAGALTIQTTSAGWGVNAYGPFGSNPHVVRLVSGAAIGRQYKIASNTSDTLTLVAGSDLTGVASTDTYQIFPTATLQSLFGATGTGLNVNADPTLADNVLLRGSSSWITYFNDGTQWVRQGPGTVSNNVAVSPEQGFLFVRRAGTAYTFTALGAVPITNLQTDFPANQITAFGNRFPVDTNLVGLGLDLQPGWNKNADPTLADNVLVRGSSWITYYFDPTAGVNSWVRQGPQTPNQNPPILTGTSVVVVRRAGSNVTLNQALPYTLP